MFSSRWWAPFFVCLIQQAGQVQTLQQRDSSRSGWHGVGGLPRHGRQGAAVWRWLPASFWAQHAHPVRSGPDCAHPGALQLQRWLPNARRTPKSQGDQQGSHVAAGAPLPKREHGFLGRVWQSVALPEEGRELVHATAAHRHQEDRGLVQRDGGRSWRERPVGGKWVRKGTLHAPSEAAQWRWCIFTHPVCVCVCVFVSVFQFSAKSEVQWEAHSFSCPRSSSSSTGCVSRTWWDTEENILAFTLLFLHNTCVYEHGRGGSVHLWPRIQMQHTPRGQRCLVDVSLTLFTARFSDPKQVVDNSNAAVAEAVTPFCNLQQKRLPLGEVHGD